MVSECSPSLGPLTRLIFHSLLSSAIRSLYGLVGVGQYSIDILSLNEEKNGGIIRIDAQSVLNLFRILFLLQLIRIRKFPFASLIKLHLYCFS